MRTPREPDYVLDAHRVGKELSVEITRERAGRADGGPESVDLDRQARGSRPLIAHTGREGFS